MNYPTGLSGDYISLSENCPFREINIPVRIAAALSSL